MAVGTGIGEGVAGQAGAQIQLRQPRVAAVFEGGQRHVGLRQLVMAAAAEFGGVAGGASGTVECRISAMHIVFPARSVGSRHHYLMAADALLLRLRVGRHILVAGEAIRAGCRCIIGMMRPEACGVRCGFDGWADFIRVTTLAVRHAQRRCRSSRGAVTGRANRHLRQGQCREARALYHRGVTGHAVQGFCLARLKMHSMREFDGPRPPCHNYRR